MAYSFAIGIRDDRPGAIRQPSERYERDKPATAWDLIRAYLNKTGCRNTGHIKRIFKRSSTDFKNSAPDRLSYKELEFALNSFSLELTRKEIESLFDSFDQDKDITISLAEFVEGRVFGVCVNLVP